MGYSEAEAARFLGMTTSAVNRLTVSERLTEVSSDFKVVPVSLLNMG